MLVSERPRAQDGPEPEDSCAGQRRSPPDGDPVLGRCQFQGELVDSTGDEALAILPGALHAVDCALAPQAALRDDRSSWGRSSANRVLCP
jgi:hypothetical protein